MERLEIFHKFFSARCHDYANWIIIISIILWCQLMTPCLLYWDALLPWSQKNIELQTSRHEFADRIHQNKQEFAGEKRSEGKTGRKSSPFQEHVAQSSAIGHLHAQILSVSLPQFSRLFCLLSSKILQNSLLDLYLVHICRYKLSLFAKPAHKNSPRLAIKFKIFESLVCDGQKSTGAGTRQVIG